MRINPRLEDVISPPIVEVYGWLRGREFPPDRPLIDLTQAAPDTPPALELVTELADRLHHPDLARYTSVEGIFRLREALARHHGRRYGAPLSPEHFVVTAGANQAFWSAVLAVAGEGDEVIVPVPYYFNHVMTLRMLGVRPVLVPFREETGGVPDPDEVAALLTARTRAILLVTPNNPTGSVCPPEVLEALADLAASREAALILDETYVDLLPEGDRPHRLFSRDDWQDLVIHLYSLSKTLAIPGYRVGALAAGRRVLEQVMKIQDCVVICAPHPSQHAALYGLEHLDAWLAAQREAAGTRRRLFARELERLDAPYRLVASGAYFAWVRHPFEGRPAAEVARLLLEGSHLLVLPGTVFGPGLDPYLRLAVANVPEGNLRWVARRLAGEA